MDPIARAIIEKRIDELERERDALVQQANQQVSAYAGGIGELKRLLELPKPVEQAEHPQCDPELLMTMPPADDHWVKAKG
ncbi:MAG: hypothetical protein ACYC4L_11450 [Chloroflexota bacterium]